MRQWNSGYRARLLKGCFALSAALLVALTAPVQAQDYPNRPVRMIVAFAAGGPTDVLARTLAERLSEELGQSVIIENRGGAGGIVGYGAAASAPPDGYTIAFVDPSLTVNPSLHKNLPYDVERDFTPISSVVRGPTVLVIPKTFDAKTAAEFVSVAKRNPGKFSYGSAGTGTPPHLNAELFKIAQGIELKHVPYRGAAPAITDLIAGRIDAMFLNIGSAKAQIDAGALIGLAVSGSERVAKLPNVPTFRESGLPVEQLDTGTWWGVVGPAKLPAAIQQKLNRAVNDALKNPQLRARLDEMNVAPIPSSAEAFGKLISDERLKWADVVKRANITME